MKSRSVSKKLAGALAALTLGGVSVGVVQARTPRPTPTVNATELSTVQSRCDTAVKTRVSALQADITKLNADNNLSSSDKSSLLATANSDISGLQALDATIQADTTVQQARSDCQKIVNDYRVFALFAPQLHLTVTTDRLSAAVTKIQGTTAKLTTLVGKISDPAQQATAQAALADLNSKLAAAQSSLSGLSGVLSLNPSGYPGNKSSLQTMRSSLEAIRQDLKAVRTDVQTIKTAVQASHPSKGASPTPSPTAT